MYKLIWLCLIVTALLRFIGIQALMGAASQSSEDSPTSCDGTQKIQVLALARAIANSSPNPYDKDALKFSVRIPDKKYFVFKIKCFA